MTATPTTKKAAAKAPAKKAPAKKAAPDAGPPTAMHREAPFGPNGGALYYNSVIDRWYAFARIVDADGTRRRKTTAARSRDDAYAALVVIRENYVLADA
jgi:hypothetical protein